MGTRIYLGKSGLPGPPGPPGAATTFGKLPFVLTPADIVNQFVLIPAVVVPNSVSFFVGDSNMKENTDYLVTPFGLNTKIEFLGELQPGGATELLSGMEIRLEWAV